MKYQDDEYSPDLGDLVEVCTDLPPYDRARVVRIGKKKVMIRYEVTGAPGLPQSEWVLSTDCNMISREG